MYENKRILIIGAFFLLAFGCLGGKNEIIFNENQEFKSGETYTWWFEAKQGETISIDIKVLSGAPIDVLILDANGYADYNYNLGGGVKDFETMDHKLSVKAYQQDFKVDKTGNYYVVADNTILPKNGAEPTGDVKVSAKIVSK